MKLVWIVRSLVVGIAAWAPPMAYASREPGISTDTYPVHLNLGERKFQIPRNYFWYLSKPTRAEPEGANLHAALPDFEAPSAANISLFRTPGSAQTVTILLEEHNRRGRTNSALMDRAAVLARISTGQFETPQPSEPAPTGLSRMAMRQSTDELFVGKTKSGELYWVRCRPVGSVPFPSCSSTFAYSDQVYVKYTFARSVVNQWEQIDSGVNALIRRFDQSK